MSICCSSLVRGDLAEGEEVASSQGLCVFCSKEAKRSVSVTGLIDELVLVQESSNCTQRTHLKYLNGVEHEWLERQVSKADSVKGHCGGKRSCAGILSPCWQSWFWQRDISYVHKHLPTVSTNSKQIVPVRVADMLSFSKLASLYAGFKDWTAWHYNYLHFWIKRCLMCCIFLEVMFM